MRLILTSLTVVLLWSNPIFAETPDVSSPSPLKQQVQNDITFLTGGVGERELKRLNEKNDDYNVRVAITRSDGAFLSAVDVEISDSNGKTLVQTTTHGPILLAELKPGRYMLKARSEGRMTEQRVIDIPNQRDQVRLYVAMENSKESTEKDE